ncbi:MAG: hypothetical protein K0S76_1639 [Herbinix sp.]|jgi:hypothetical protein|nr:hypothetical protein [Herbinix sp.]
MSYSNLDKTTEVEGCCSAIPVKSTDYCRYFVKHPHTLLQRKECWTCRYSDFGIDTGTVNDKGICRYQIYRSYKY